MESALEIVMHVCVFVSHVWVLAAASSVRNKEGMTLRLVTVSRKGSHKSTLHAGVKMLDCFGSSVHVYCAYSLTTIVIL